MEFHEDVKQLSMRLMPTGALLLTILAFVHPHSIFMFWVVYGLYSSIAIGAVVFLFLIIRKREGKWAEAKVSDKWTLAFFVAQLAFFLVGLLGVVVVVVAVS